MDTPVAEVATPWDASRRAHLSFWRALNTSLDTVFYDVDSLSPGEKSLLSTHLNPEGLVVLVPPRLSGASIRFLTPLEFVQQHGLPGEHAVDAIVVAGVGSSAVGTAALARNVADHLQRPVAGVVSGLGLADVISEAVGGWFVLGAENAVRDALARLFDACQLKDHVRDPASHRDMTAHFDSVGIDRDRFIYGSPDSTALLYLLSKLGRRIALLVGHSKGNYSIDNALRGWLAAGEATSEPVPSDLCIVTLGAVIRLPSHFARVHQFIGQIDFFGMMNSRAGLEHVWVPNAWHSLNALVPGHVAVSEALRAVGVR